MKLLLANSLSAFPIKNKPGFSDGLSRLPRNPPNCNTFDSWVLKNFILADEAFS